MKTVEIIWIDAQSSLEQLTLEEAKQIEPHITKSVGYLAYEDKDKILLCFTDFNNGIYKHWQMIPKGMIINRRKLKWTNKQKKQ